MQTIVSRFLQYPVPLNHLVVLSPVLQDAFSTALIALMTSMLPVFATPTAEPEAAPGSVLEKRANTVYVCSGESVIFSTSSSS